VAVVDDALLPAAAHLTGPWAADVVAAAVGAVGGEVRSARASHVQYRPGAEVIVRFEASVAWHGRAPVVETLLASSTTSGVMAGTVPVTASTPGGDLAVGVWRWPFDPRLPGLADAVTPTAAAALLGDRQVPRLRVVAYRPAERAVVQATSADGRVAYVKVVEPALLAATLHRHDRLLAAGVPVPAIRSHDPARGIFVMDELPGDTLRDRLKRGTGPWPSARELMELAGRLQASGLTDVGPARDRLGEAVDHARLLAAVLPSTTDLLDGLLEGIAPTLARSALRRDATIHGDLHEGQLVVAGHRITGLLDVDEVGVGDPLADQATVLAHLRFRAATARTGRAALTAYADQLRSGFGSPDLDTATAAALIGLATGPFRVQQPGWERAVIDVLDLAAALLAR
jgi:hypothetical protein